MPNGYRIGGNIPAVANFSIFPYIAVAFSFSTMLKNEIIRTSYTDC